jgi:regulator of protease activity HflC (stomatin/prohibitin superfamily)
MLLQFLPSVHIVLEYQRAAVFRLGRLVGFRGPGLVFRIPVLERFQIIDMRIATEDVTPQECITRDNIPLHVNAVAFFRVQDPETAIVRVVDYSRATIELAQTTLRSVIGQRSLNELLHGIDEAALKLREILDSATDEWGVKVTRVEIKDVQIPDTLKRAMAKEAEAERERRAMVIRATGEQEASAQLAQAATILDQSGSGFRLRYLQAVIHTAESGSTVVFAPTNALTEAMAAAGAHGGIQSSGRPR